jgi:hypothetical protein
MSNSAVPTQAAVFQLELHPGAEVDALAVAAPPLGLDVDDHHALETLAQETHAPIDLVQPLLAVGVFGVL